MPYISVIIPNYNGSRWLPATLDSCLNQKEFLKEIIVVDDFSTDDSWAILENYCTIYPDIIKIHQNENKGGNNARNLGFRKSTGDYIQWLDADDQVCEGKFGNQLKALQGQPGIDIVYSDWQIDTYAGNGHLVLNEFIKNHTSSDFLLKILKNDWSAPHVYLMKREMAELLNLKVAWNPETTVGQDREYFTIAAILGAKFGYAPGNYAIYNRWNKSSVSNVNEKIRFRDLEKMLTRFEALLAKQDWISQERMSNIAQIIFTERLLLKTLGHPVCFESDSILKFKNVRWKSISGFRTSVKVFLTFIRLKLKIEFWPL